MFKNLTQEEENDYRQWARNNYQPYSEIKGIWHPVVQDECVKINQKGIACSTSMKARP